MFKKFSDFLSISLIEYGDQVITVGNIFFIVVLFLSIFLIIKLLALIADKSALRHKLDEGQRYSLHRILQYFLYTIGIVLALENVGISITILLAGSAALLVGIGLGLQHFFNDVMSGFILLFDGSVQVGDVVLVDGLVARVQKIAIRTTKVITRDGNYLIVPNSIFTSNKVENWSHEQSNTRFSIRVGVAYGSDTAKVKSILEDCANNHTSVRNDRVMVFFADFADSALLFDLYFWSDELWAIEKVKSEIRFLIDEQFRAKGVRIPFPQRDLHLISTPKDVDL